MEKLPNGILRSRTTPKELRDTLRMDDGPLKSNISYAIQLLELLDYLIGGDKFVAGVAHQMLIKTYIQNVCEIMHALFRNLLATSCKYPKETKFGFKWCINAIHEDGHLSIVGNKERDTLHLLRNLRDKTHLYLAEEYNASDFNSFGETEFYWSKHVFYNIITNSQFCLDKSFFQIFAPKSNEIEHIRNNPLTI